MRERVGTAGAALIRVVLIDDHPVVREGLSAILAGEPDIEVVGQAEDAEQGLDQVTQLGPDIVVLDVRLPGMGGVEACTVLRDENPRVRTIVLTSFPSEGVMLAALAAGARGFLVKESDPSVLRTAVRTVYAGGSVIDPRLTGRLVAAATKRRGVKGPFDLTVQELRVLALLPRGLSNRDIGKELNLSEQTVKSHLQHAMRKLSVHDRVQAASFVVREGLV